MFGKHTKRVLFGMVDHSFWQVNHQGRSYSGFLIHETRVNEGKKKEGLPSTKNKFLYLTDVWMCVYTVMGKNKRGSFRPVNQSYTSVFAI